MPRNQRSSGRDVSDVLVVGGGPAGASAALVLARACRHVIVVDAGRPRNRSSLAIHNVLTREGIAPLEFRRMAHAELRHFGVRVVQGEVMDAGAEDGGFHVTLRSGRSMRSRVLLLATGVVDIVPEIPGLRALYGRSVHHCPYCDGWPWRGRRLAALGEGRHGAGLALALRGWSDDVVALTGGEGRVPRAVQARLASHGIPLREERIARLEGAGGNLRRVRFAGGEAIERDALFFNTGAVQSSPLPRILGCAFDRRGGVKVDKKERTCVPGVYMVGDATNDLQFVAFAAAEGAKAGVAIAKELQRREGRML